MYDVFLSYSRKDTDRARSLVALMQNRFAWTVFFDKSSIRSGDDFARFIDDMLNQSVCVVVLWSDNSVKSKWVLREAATGLKNNCLYPLLLDQTAAPKIPAAFQHINAIDLSEWDGGTDYENLSLLLEPIAKARREALAAVQEADLPQFSEDSWRAVGKALDEHREGFGWPRRQAGSVILGSFNIRKLGPVARRPQDVWRFLAAVCRQFDLLAIQEVMDDLSGLRHLLQLIGGHFAYLVSDVRGYGYAGAHDRRAFIFNTERIRHTGLVATIDGRAQPENAVGRFHRTGRPVRQAADNSAPSFPGFYRQPLVAGFEILGRPESPPLGILAVNAHLRWESRSTEFGPLAKWIAERIGKLRAAYPPNVILFGDLGMGLRPPRRDPVAAIKALIPPDEDIDVCFPFLEPHPTQSAVFHTNLRGGEGTGQIAVLSRDKRLQRDMKERGQSGGADYGVFDLANLMSVAQHGAGLDALSREQQRQVVKSYEYIVSDSIPLWLRVPLPGRERKQVTTGTAGKKKEKKR